MNEEFSGSRGKGNFPHLGRGEEDINVGQILRKYGLTRDNAAKYVVLSPVYNRKALANKISLNEDSVHRYRRAFKDMNGTVRCRVIAALAADLADERKGQEH